MTDIASNDIAQALREATLSHHERYFDLIGKDPAWLECYAEQVVGKVSSLLKTELVPMDLVHLLTLGFRIYKQEKRDCDWPDFFADYLVKRSGY